MGTFRRADGTLVPRHGPATHPAPRSPEQCLDKWAASHAGLHTSAAMRTELDELFEERFFVWTPYLNWELGKAIDIARSKL